MRSCGRPAALPRTAPPGREKPEDLDDALFSSYLDSAGIPDPDLVIPARRRGAAVQFPAVAVRLRGVLL